MFWKKKTTEASRLAEEAVDLACNLFATGPLHGSDSQGWTDTASATEPRTIAYRPSPHTPYLVIRGRMFGLTKAQAERINNTIARRVLNAQHTEEA